MALVILKDGFVLLARAGSSQCGGTDRTLKCLTKALGSFPSFPPRVLPTPVLKGII